MKKKNYLYIYVVAMLSFIVPIPPRFAYGFLCVLLLNFLVVAAFGLQYLIKKISLNAHANSLMLLFLVGCTILFKQLLILYSAITALVLSLSLYMVCFSSFLMGTVFNTEGLTLVEHARFTAKRLLVFSSAVLSFFLIREILAFGTLSFAVKDGLACLTFFNVSSSYPLLFLGTIPGTLILLGLAFALYTLYKKLQGAHK